MDPLHDTAVLAAEHLSKSFGAVDALIDASLSLCAGEIHALVGGNGAGKSTLVNILAGNFRADSGRILLDGEPVRFSNPRAARAKGIATVYQNLALVDALDVPANVFLGREILLSPPLGWLGFLNNRKMRASARAELDRLQVPIPDIDQRVIRMSGGQRQCIACIRALMGGARVLMMDEPTAALGVKETAQVQDLMRKCRDEGAAILLISHNMEDVFALADRITVMRLGKTLVTADKERISPETVVGLITGAVSAASLDRDRFLVHNTPGPF